MPMKTVTEPPKHIQYFPDEDDLASRMKPEHVESVREIFNTPLTGAYNWDYLSCDGRIRKLYQLGKELNWDAEMDLDWTDTIPRTEYCTDQNFNLFRGYEPYEQLSEEEKIRFDWHQLASNLSQFLHGEQGALLVSSQLVSCAPTYDAKLYAASQSFDEARHVEVFNTFIQKEIGVMYPVHPSLKALLDKILTDPRWDLKFIGMQIILEGLALAAFKSNRAATRIPVLSELLRLVIRDEARHVTFGVNYLEEFCKSLSEEERDERAQFAYEACVVMRDRLVPGDVFEEFGWDVEAARKRVLESSVLGDFRNLLFSRIVPNLKRIGLLTENVRPKFESLGLLTFEHLDSDSEIDWARLSKPLFEESDSKVA
ncbi:MAG: ferritin-like domain-containing protein [Pseudomonadales bacterium]|nr:ferritin-like domain-containing protein [Pseudomonadales bacterium]